MGVGEQEPGRLLLEEEAFSWGVVWGEGTEAGGWQQITRVELLLGAQGGSALCPDGGSAACPS